jgi:hypothetical protein
MEAIAWQPDRAEQLLACVKHVFHMRLFDLGTGLCHFKTIVHSEARL